MSAEEFCIWLSGFANAANSYNITPKQWEMVQEKLQSVFDFYTEGDEDSPITIIRNNEWCMSSTIPPTADRIIVEYIEK